VTVTDATPDRVVLDASFVLRYVLHTESTRPDPMDLQKLQQCELLVPALWNAEVANALVQTERRGHATAAKIGRALSAICALNPLVDPLVVDVQRTLEVSRAYGLRAYDALYFELALRRKAALATFDDAMIVAAPSAGIRLFPSPAS